MINIEDHVQVQWYSLSYISLKHNQMLGSDVSVSIWITEIENDEYISTYTYENLSKECTLYDYTNFKSNLVMISAANSQKP